MEKSNFKTALAGVTALLFALTCSAYTMPYEEGFNSLCTICEPEFCPKSAEDCPRGVSEDRCGCCSVGQCQLAEGDRCLDTILVPAISKTDLGKYGSCGERMICTRRTDVDPEGVAESVCSCMDSTVVCGSDNRTYENTCKMQDAQGRPQLAHVGPCSSTPVIAAAPQDVIEVEGSSLALDCEVTGFPVPAIQWEFQSADGATKLLPGDDTAVVVQSRGGPEHTMVTSWVQIMSARREDSGTYVCVASNMYGVARAISSVRINAIV